MPTLAFPTLRVCLSLVTLMSGVGCRGDGVSQASVVRDSAGIRIIEHASDDPPERWVVDTQPRVRIGGGDDEGDTTHQLFNVVDVKRLSDGRIVIANSGSSELRYFAPDGPYLATVGRSGGGPGEFRRILRLFPLPGDSLMVHDPMAPRLSIFDDSGRFVRAHPIGRSPFGQPTVRGRLGDGRLIGFAMLSEPFERPGRHVQNGMFLLFSDSVTMLDSLGRLPVAEAEGRLVSGGQALYFWPFHASGLIGISGNELVYMWGASSEIRFISSSGVVERIVRLAVPPREFTADMRTAVGERLAAARSPGARLEFQRDWSSLDFPEHVPNFSVLMIDHARNVWLQEHALDEPASRRWLVVAPDGSLLADVVLPGRLRVMEIGEDYVLGTMRDEMDLESVVLLELSRRPK